MGKLIVITLMLCFVFISCNNEKKVECAGKVSNTTNQQIYIDYKMNIFIGFLFSVISGMIVFYYNKYRTAKRLYGIIRKYYSNINNFSYPCTVQINEIAKYIIDIEKLYNIDVSALFNLRSVYIDYELFIQTVDKPKELIKEYNRGKVKKDLDEINWKY